MALIELQTDPTESQLRWFGVLWFPATLAVAGAVVWKSAGWVPAHYGLAAAAAVAALLGLARPRWLRWLFVGVSVAVFPIGIVVSFLLLVVIYYLVLTPTGLVLRIFGRDALSRRLDPDAETYWVPLGEPAPKSRYFRQY